MTGVCTLVLLLLYSLGSIRGQAGAGPGTRWSSWGLGSGPTAGAGSSGPAPTHRSWGVPPSGSVRAHPRPTSNYEKPVAYSSVPGTSWAGSWSTPGPAVVSGPQVLASSGAVWPQPARLVSRPTRFVLRVASFQIVVAGENCDVLREAVSRYETILRLEASVRRRRARGHSGSGQNSWEAELNSLIVSPGRCESWPYPDMDESYHLSIAASDSATRRPIARLSSLTVWGALRGLETFVQLTAPTGDGMTLTVNATNVDDAPRFPHRGLLIDTSRHFLPVEDIKLEISAMAAVKMNVLHWHIVDDQSFPWQSAQFPDLSERGAYDPGKVYKPHEVQEVIEHARLHGIRVMPEFDTPGHTTAWGDGQPGLLATCHDSAGRPTGAFSNIDPTKPANLRFLRKLFREIASVFPEPMMHLGGDEVSSICWDSDPGVLAYMENRNMTGDFHRLQFEYLRWLVQELRGMNRSSIVWQEAWQNGNFLPDDVIVHVWLGQAMPLMSRVTSGGFRALLSESWYLDSLGQSWQRMYAIEPQDFPGTPQQLALVSGGEACMWGEMVDETNVHSRVWPRTAAVAERLWSPKTVTDTRSAAPRLEELVCRLRRRGVPASPPNGPGYCP